MFDVGFWELALVGVVALLVVGPDKLPGLARTVGLYVGRARRMVAQVRADIEREIHADELKKSLAETEGLQDAYRSLEQTRNELRAAVSSSGDAGASTPVADPGEPGAAARGAEAESGSPAGQEPGPAGEPTAAPVPGPRSEPSEAPSTDTGVEPDERRADS